MALEGYPGGCLAHGLHPLHGDIHARGIEVEPLCGLPLPCACRLLHLQEVGRVTSEK